MHQFKKIKLLVFYITFLTFAKGQYDYSLEDLNSSSSSYGEVVLRAPLGSNDKEESGSFHPDIDTNYLEFAGVEGSSIENGFIIENYVRRIGSNIGSAQTWEEVIETHISRDVEDQIDDVREFAIGHRRQQDWGRSSNYRCTDTEIVYGGIETALGRCIPPHI